MQPGERIDIITRIATQLAARDDWDEIDLILEQFGFPTMWAWEGDEKSYIIECVKGAANGDLVTLDQYLMGQSRPADEPWEDTGFRLFLSHVVSQKRTAHSLKTELGFYGVDAFVAHDDIPAGKEWRVVIESALHSCNALAGLLHEGFRESPWCDQEVGMAIGRGIPVVPIQFDLHPYGFFGSVQAVKKAVSRNPKNLARSVVQILVKDKRTSEKLTQAIVNRLARATSFDQANQLSRILAEDAPLLSKGQVQGLRVAEKENDQLQGAFDFDDHLSSIEARIHNAGGEVVSSDTEGDPF